MPYLRATYKRTNWTVKPTMHQRMDVLFFTSYDGEYDMSGVGDSINPYWLPSEVDEALGIAAKEQLGDVFKTDLTDKEWGGWSSVTLDEVIPIDDPLNEVNITDPVDGKPQIGELFEYRDGRYRLSGFYKEYVSKRKPDPMIDEILAELDAERPPDPYHAGKRKIKLISCFPHEATYVSGSSVGGCLADIRDIKVTGLVGWCKRYIARQRIDYDAGIQREIDSDDFPHLTVKWIAIED